MAFDAQAAEAALQPRFAHFDRVAQENTRRVLQAFRRARVSDTHFAGATGYGLNDAGRDVLDAVMAEVMGCEDACVRVQFVSGTHAISCAMMGVLRPGDLVVSATGRPYDTIHATLRALGEWGIRYEENGPVGKARAVMIQRSRGYAARKSLSMADIRVLCAQIRAQNPEALILVDNCYGEFVETEEPGHAGADLVMGSLIKNPGGGLAVTGAYIAGKREWVRRAAERLTAPGLGKEYGGTLGQARLLFQGLLQAPHVVAQALKTVSFGAAMLSSMGYEVDPAPLEERYDIIQRIRFGDPAPLIAFCQGIQRGSPVDAFVTPLPAPMPGYDDEVIMAAGTFIQGASIELSCDAPLRAPYDAFMQGGLTYEMGKLCVMEAVKSIHDCAGH